MKDNLKFAKKDHLQELDIIPKNARHLSSCATCLPLLFKLWNFTDCRMIHQCELREYIEDWATPARQLETWRQILWCFRQIDPNKRPQIMLKNLGFSVILRGLILIQIVCWADWVAHCNIDRCLPWSRNPAAPWCTSGKKWGQQK